MRENPIESRAYVKLIQRLETRRVCKSWDEKGVFDLVKIDAEPQDKNRSCMLGSEQMRIPGMALLHASPNRIVSQMDSQVIGRIRLERGARRRTATAGFESLHLLHLDVPFVAHVIGHNPILPGARL